MARERAFEFEPREGVRVRVRFHSDRGKVTGLVVQLEARVDGKWFAVVRYDTAHGRPHKDVMNRSGKQIEKTWLLGTLNDVLTFSIDDVTNNAADYLAHFLENGS